MIGKELGPYRILSELGSGAMGTVYLVEVTGRAPGLEEGQQVALKVIHSHLLATPGYFKRFLQEAQIGKKVRHENVVRTYDVDALLFDGKQLNYLVVEYVQGQTLRSLLDELDHVPEELCRHIGSRVADGLSAIHEAGAIHRDLKPENVLITKDEVIKIMDLGLARVVDEAIRLSQSGIFVGSLLYAAPEQFLGGGKSVDGRADIYALGLLLYELATGKHPFGGGDSWQAIQRVLQEEAPPPSELQPQLSPFFDEAVRNMLAKERDDRFASALDVAEVLEEGERSRWWGGRSESVHEEARKPLRRIHTPHQTALYGRSRALEALRSAYRGARAGEGRVLFLEGEAGIGKTRLLDEFAEKLLAQEEEVHLLFGSYPPGGAATEAGAFATAYREHFGRERLEKALRPYLPETPLLIPAFAALLKGSQPPRGEQELTKDSVQTVFVHTARALAAERPTVILLEDLQFAPEEGLALFAALALSVAGHRILVVGTSRPGLPAEWINSLERLSHVSRHLLERLGAKDLMQLLVDAFGSQPLAEELALKIAQKSDGNPFFVFEIIQGLREEKILRQEDDGTWARTSVIRTIEIPSTVMDMIQARISALDRDEREILDVASCCGFEFDPTLVADALGKKRIPTLRMLAHTEQLHRLVRSSGRAFVFDHHQVQEALYSGLPEPLREEYHAALGDALEERAGSMSSASPEQEGALATEITLHFMKGGRGRRAQPYLDTALDFLEHNYNNAAAIELVDQALAPPRLLKEPERSRILVRKAGLLDLLGHPDEAGAALEEALDLAHDSGDLALQSGALQALGSHFVHVAQYQPARNHLENALYLARKSEDKRLEARATASLGVVLRHLGRFEEARTRLEAALELATSCGDHHVEAIALGNLGVALAALGRNDDARTYLQRSAELAAELGDRVQEGWALDSLGILFDSLGRYTEAREYHVRSLELERMSGNRRGQATSIALLGRILSQLGKHEPAREHHVNALELAREIGDRRVEGIVLHGLGAVEERAERTEEALPLFTQALDLRRQIGSGAAVAETLVALGRLHALGGNQKAALEHLTEAETLGEKLGLPEILVLCAAYRALLPEQDASRALNAFRTHQKRLSPRVRMEVCAMLYKATGDESHLDEAHRMLLEFRDQAPEDSRASMLAGVPLHDFILRAKKS
ncbi:MAG: tetratricopeptide repeat protein [Planctomycetota bacterium]|nr:tetratricopeptide repeat protein [Planctomycetota bacterium]